MSSHHPSDSASFPEKVTVIGNYPPRRCGIATFTHDLRKALTEARPECSLPVVTLTDQPESYDYPSEVRLEIMEDQLDQYAQAGHFIDDNGGQAICLQHEFGIFGGPSGEHLLELLDNTELPVVTTLHTVLTHPNDDQKRVFEKIAKRSSRLVVMSEKGREILRQTWQVPENKIAVIPHGIPDVPFTDPCFFRDKFDLQGRKVILTFGLIGPGKGIEDGIRAMPEVVANHSDVTYVILGATHPNLVKHEGEAYRESLIQLADDLGVRENVRFVNQYVSLEELLEWIGAADIYLTPYLNEAQITSGTLAQSFGAGKAIVSTRYWHAQEILQDGCGKLADFQCPTELTKCINELLDDPTEMNRIRRAAYEKGRATIWSSVAKSYHQLFADVALERLAAPASAVAAHQPQLSEASPRPDWQMEHVLRMSDSTGMFQHARLHLPWFEHGYCTDDNARALLLTAELEAQDALPAELKYQQASYAAFLEHAFNQDSRRFRNFLSFDRKWLEEVGSEDSHGRALWALGVTLNKTKQATLRRWAADIFEQSFETVEEFTSPRTWAFSILGLTAFLDTCPGDLHARKLVKTLAQRLEKIFLAVASDDWCWFENSVTYDNSRLPEAMIRAGQVLKNDRYEEIGLRSLRWLLENQTGSDGCFRPVGSNGFWERGSEPAFYDQQPLEAAASVAACHSTIDSDLSQADRHFFHQQAVRCHNWFMGRNDLKVSLYDKETGGCFDGLRSNRVNRNQGAESTLSFWLSLADLKAMETAMATSQSAQVAVA